MSGSAVESSPELSYPVKPDLSKLSQIIGYTFKDEQLVLQALSHRGLGAVNYERLEFLGDSALGFIVSTELFNRKTELAEGDLTRMRARLVRGETLAAIARELELGQFLLLSEGELKSGAHQRDSILADLVESLIGAVYVEAGFEESISLVRRLLGKRLEHLPHIDELKDPKSRLQELLQANAIELPAYELVATSGEAHQQQLTIKCTIKALELETTATSSSRRKAEQTAADSALQHAKLRALPK